jgi:hypothetical protein
MAMRRMSFIGLAQDAPTKAAAARLSLPANVRKDVFLSAVLEIPTTKRTGRDPLQWLPLTRFRRPQRRDRVGGKGQGVREITKRRDGASVVELQTIQSSPTSSPVSRRNTMIAFFFWGALIFGQVLYWSLFRYQTEVACEEYWRAYLLRYQITRLASQGIS